MRNAGLTVVGIGDTLRENSTGLGALKHVLQASEEGVLAVDLTFKLKTSEEFPERKLLQASRG